MLTLNTNKSNYLITFFTVLLVGLISLFLVNSKIFAQEETEQEGSSTPLSLALFYTADNCPNCATILSELNALISETPDVLISERNTSEAQYKTEYDYVAEECQVDANTFPLFVSEKGCLTKLDEMKTRVSEMIEEARELRQTIEGSASAPIVDNSNPQVTQPQSPSASELIEPNVQTPEINPFVLIFTLAIPIAMFFAGMYIIKRFKL